MKNSDKYGDKKDDIISQAFNDRYDYGVGFCKWNINKYLERHKRVSKMPLLKRCYYLMLGKGGKSDMRKIHDYLNRWRVEVQGEDQKLQFQMFIDHLIRTDKNIDHKFQYYWHR